MIPVAAYTAAEIPNAFLLARQPCKIVLSRGWIWTTSNTRLVPLAQISQPPNGISIGPAVFAQYIHVTNTETDTIDHARPHYVRNL